MKWSNNNRACKTLWSALRATDQISKRKTFNTTGALKVQDLTYWKGAAASVKLNAKALALLLDNIFIEMRRAEYEKDVTSAKARTSMVGIMTQKTKTVTDLADVVDDAYEFRGEND